MGRCGSGSAADRIPGDPQERLAAGLEGMGYRVKRSGGGDGALSLGADELFHRVPGQGMVNDHLVECFRHAELLKANS
jgi:hypothetical protein